MLACLTGDLDFLLQKQGRACELVCPCVCLNFRKSLTHDQTTPSSAQTASGLEEYPVSFRPQRASAQVNTLIKLHPVAKSFLQDEAVNGVSSGKVTLSSLDGFLQEENVFENAPHLVLLACQVCDQREEGKLAHF